MLQSRKTLQFIGNIFFQIQKESSKKIFLLAHLVAGYCRLVNLLDFCRAEWILTLGKTFITHSFIFLIYLAVLGLSCGMQASLQLRHAGSLVVTHRLSSCGTRAAEHAGSVVAVHGLSCPTACGILVPRPGIEPASPALEGGFLTTGPPGKSPLLLILKIDQYGGL